MNKYYKRRYNPVQIKLLVRILTIKVQNRHELVNVLVRKNFNEITKNDVVDVISLTDDRNDITVICRGFRATFYYGAIYGAQFYHARPEYQNSYISDGEFDNLLDKIKQYITNDEST